MSAQLTYADKLSRAARELAMLHRAALVDTRTPGVIDAYEAAAIADRIEEVVLRGDVCAAHESLATARTEDVGQLRLHYARLTHALACLPVS